ncbi:MAG: FKBP-type peptidyl-prolyl cis-trans isomerase [Deltaproteobacteria bacterium]|nr:MAG: FKBP-type peptidyl-prolyl cis-trans isomerase [Deltaproteobacteria bacterium]
MTTWGTALGILLLALRSGAAEPEALKTRKEKASYAIGVDTARALRKQGIEVDLSILVRGLKDGMGDAPLLLSDPDLRAIRNATQNEMVRKQAAEKQKQSQARSKSAEDAKKAGEVYLAGNAKKEGVVTLPSGLQYLVLKAGGGNVPTDSDTVECHYRGTLLDGTVFDSSYGRGKPATFAVKGVIPGWREALKRMPAGSKWRLFIPPGLAYGERGAGRDIGPNATLIFDVELLSVR